MDNLDWIRQRLESFEQAIGQRIDRLTQKVEELSQKVEEAHQTALHIREQVDRLAEKVENLDQRTRRVETMLERLPLTPRVSEALPERIEVELCVSPK